MTQKKISPVLFATIVMSPIIALQLVLFLVGMGVKSSSDAAGVAVIDIVFWFVIVWVWRNKGRNRG